MYVLRVHIWLIIVVLKVHKMLKHTFLTIWIVIGCMLNLSIGQETCSSTGQSINLLSQNGYQIASDFCDRALPLPITELDGFSTLTCDLSADGPSDLAGFCGNGSSISNNLWIAFTPMQSGALTLNISVSNCIENDPNCNGIQGAIIRTNCPAEDQFFDRSFESLACNPCTNGDFQLSTSDAIAGVPHYLMLDACCEDICEISVEVLEGIPANPADITSSVVYTKMCSFGSGSSCANPESSLKIAFYPDPTLNLTQDIELSLFDPSNQLIQTITTGEFNGFYSQTWSGPNPTNGEPIFCTEGTYTVEASIPSINYSESINVDMFFETSFASALQLLEEEDANAHCNLNEIILQGESLAPENVIDFGWNKIIGIGNTLNEQDINPDLVIDDNTIIVRRLDESGNVDLESGPGEYVYYNIVEDAACKSYEWITIEEEDFVKNGICEEIGGNVFWDILDNCLYDPLINPSFQDWVIKFESAEHTFHTVSGEDGSYFIYVHPGTYQASLISPNDSWITCPAVEVVVDETLPGQAPPEIIVPLGAKINISCPLATVDVTVPRLRRCFESPMLIRYANSGTETLESSSIILEVDEFIELRNTSLPIVNLGDNRYEFATGDLDPFEDGIISMFAYVSCDAELGYTHCIEANMFPNDYCEELNQSWDGSSIMVEGIQVDDKIEFTITNVGSNMNQELSWQIIEDDLLLREGNFQLNTGEATVEEVECDDKTYRMEAQQAEFHPGDSQPSATVQGCDGVSSTGFVNQFTLDDLDLFKDIECLQNIGSFDPNDKQGFPVGITDDHCIDPGTAIDYLIRFQNTGTDTAFTVVIRDTLSDFLDPSSIYFVNASHPYELTMDGSALSFTFNDILLPDSTTNEPASNGFVKFLIQPNTTQIGTVIENRAAIYFDFNEPVITNTTLHTIDDDCLEDVVSIHRIRPIEQVTINPNPFNNSFIMNLETGYYEDLTLKIFYSNGVLFESIKTKGNNIVYSNQNMTQGIYFYELYNHDQKINFGKLIKN